MPSIMTGPKGELAYFQRKSIGPSRRAFALKGRFLREGTRNFARLSAFADNLNHAPDAAARDVTSDAGLTLLRRIADVR